MAYESRWIEKRDQILSIATQVKSAYPQAWEKIKVPGTKDREYINRVSIECQKAGIPAGVNLKRGGPEESIDVIALPNASGCGDSTQTYAGLELIDLVNGAEGPNPSLTWGDVTQKTIDAGVKGGWKAGSVEPAPNPQPTYPSYEELGGDAGGVAITRQLEADYKRAGKPGLDGDCGAWQQRVSYDFLTRKVPTVAESIAKHRPEWCAALGIPVA